MVLNQLSNKSIKQDLIDEARLNIAYDNIPSTVLPTIQPTISVEKKYVDIVRTRTTAGSETGYALYTTPTDKFFYLTNAQLSISKDAACDAATGACFIYGFVSGAIRNLIQVSTITLTAMQDTVSVTFSPPVKLDRNTAITATWAGTHTAGIFVKSAVIIGYLSDSLPY